ncbi:MAG: tripartite tricarboxylate transporter TctB family protein [Deltaproteobacteria bacterium]|jgi:putative tricarboxylic transport membrane protein
MTLNRLSGIVVAVLGALLLFWIIPRHTETVTYGWLRPTTLPNITAVTIIVSAIIHALFPAGKVEFDVRLALRAGMFFGISLLGIWLMHRVGFLISAPLLVTVIMLLIGERRPVWLVSGIVLVPVGIWCIIELLLKRPLP